MNINKIIKTLERQGISMHELSNKCGVPYSTLHDILNGKAKNPRVDTVSKIAEGLNMSINEILNEEGIDEESNIENKEKEN
ncbi:helix-turn-helix domain-containing protein [Clostridium sp. SHJSY1]|uniref:helix-turn-helix domain-containing protein n=1 Tax=Clostridium sp. SHJSY1 TaxID=2942483 RepID=UPI002875DDB8|nr:helix-turn-helix transcriptional regulator [Clostridium sp. SHJSY1]MDS0527846.1 helix-turn-helix domain-containing protein [Clostridium sp. SHJSY1]